MMKTYLVGGAVRDALLGYPIRERDWVVVGATPQDLINLNYKQVGHDFPVFLHPKTKEEYALARMERKQGKGYYGFICDFSPTVTLEDDLMRRDLTINAMAQDDDGRLIDPYGGQADLAAKRLRHVSPAFVEDPVRVLRVARFAARYHHLGFDVAEDTLALMYQMVQQGELNHLVPERVWQELYLSLQERHPEVFIQVLRACGALKVILPEVDQLFGVPARVEFHPEIDTGIHTLMVLSEASLASADPMIRFAALVHDLGKACTPMAHWPAQKNHGELGVGLIQALCARLRVPAKYRTFACLVSRYHLEIHRLFELDAKAIVTVLEKTDAFRRDSLFEQLLMVCQADAYGRGIQEKAYPQADEWRRLLRLCQAIDPAILINAGYQGADIKAALHEERVNCVRKSNEK